LSPFALSYTTVYRVDLTGESGATGWGLLTVDTVRSEVRFIVSHDVADATEAHFVQAPAGESETVVYQLAASASPLEGAWDISPVDFEKLTAGGLYLMICSEKNPLGELKGKVADGTEAEEFAVTITNLTYGQPFSPPVVVSHHRSVSLFQLGGHASDGLTQIAEEGVNGSIMSEAMANEDVLMVAQAEGTVGPGESTTVNIMVAGNQTTITVMGKLFNTNDAFFASSALQAPPPPLAFKASGPLDAVYSASAIAYDAGTEFNNEACDYIPGPYCEGTARDTEGAEGYISISNGVHDIFQLDPVLHDWRGPVAAISMKRL
jgi:hypothetical protein